MGQILEELLAEPGALMKGPYVSLKLPFVGGSNPRFFPHIPLPFLPHRHQELAFTRLGGRRKLSTLIATGTGSGKTESFLLPILDHCRAEAGQPGIKAILIYPMNALATDQALRLARLIHHNPALRRRVRAGLYIGEGGGHGPAGLTMSATSIITDHSALQDSPPDILLTNYKMLDYLLLRPGDQRIWQHNTRGTLRFLVVDEIHTFDGAQGTDLACLLRRLKRRLQADDRSLCCVGTSATLGGQGSGSQLREYAAKVFGETFDDHAVITETRLDEAAFLAGCEKRFLLEPGPEDLERLDPTGIKDPAAWLAEQISLFFGRDLADELAALPIEESKVPLGRHLKHHATFQALLFALEGRSRELDEVVKELARSRQAWRDLPQLGRLAVTSLIALVSFARCLPADVPTSPAESAEPAEPLPLLPFLDVRVQLWQRELRRMVATVGPRPRLRHAADLDQDGQRNHLPLVHCRDCGALGWATLVQRDKKHLLRTDLEVFYRAYFGNDPRIRFLYPAAAVAHGDPAWEALVFTVDSETLTKVGPDEPPSESHFALVAPPNTRSGSAAPELSKDCLFCGARDSLTLLGFQAATLTAVYIDQLFASPFNEDKKLLTFSDSVQDAAHRAGFFGARTYSTNLRIAIAKVIHEEPGLSLAELAGGLGRRWQERLGTAAYIATFLAPNMRWLADWDRLRKTGHLPAGSNLRSMVQRRLAFEVYAEFGLQAGIGRSLERTGQAVACLDENALENAVAAALEELRNEVGGLRELDAARLRQAILGLLHHLRHRGGILPGELPAAYLDTGGEDVNAFWRDGALPAYTRTSRLPTLLTDRRAERFESWGEKSWYSRWVRRIFGSEHLVADAGSVFSVLLPHLVRAGLLEERRIAKGQPIWGVSAQNLRVETAVTALECSACRHRVLVASAEAAHWLRLPCLTARCAGGYGGDAAPARDYFGRLYQGGDLQRIFTEEHTGLLDRSERERVEREFKAPAGSAEDPLARRPWYANLLSCTPTLEMGIDIGDLSSVVLCSVPPGQANYLQRIGRAGRRDGNAFQLTVAQSKPHDLFFFADPLEMISGEITPPGVFLNAPAVLERQLTAFAIDRWVATSGSEIDLPPQLRTVFSHLDDQEAGRFPLNWLAFVERNEPTLLREFAEMFLGDISPGSEEHLRAFLAGGDGGAGLRWRILDTFDRERRQRDSLSSKARSLREAIKKLEESPAPPLDVEEQLQCLEEEKEALLAVVKEINLRRTLEFLTDQGLLPNYAFPESAVRLCSVIWRKKKVDPDAKDVSGSGASQSGRGGYETWTYEYQRAPAAALSELAPGSEFYASGRRVEIDRVDVQVAQVENWRFCNECNHAQRSELGDEAAACPSCGSTGWRDAGQLFRLLKLQQVFATSPDRSSRIRDDRDDRQPRFFDRQILVTIDNSRGREAWRVDDDKMPFGFEYLQRATFREVNFGEPNDQGVKSTIAGREMVRPGFELCGRCGKVRKGRRALEHSLVCPSLKDGAKEKIESCLYLYREFSSEALRLLLPMADLSTTRQLHSFVAALQLGLRALFGGRVDHLRTTLYSEPVQGSTLRRQYLVLFDTVPGGTGYLKQLAIAPETGGQRLLFAAMRAALEQIENCACFADPARDGCYRCLYAYRNSRDMDDTSAQTASELLRLILAGEGRLKKIQSLGEINISGLMDSVLEVRFLEALRRVAGKDGRLATLRPAVVNQKPGWLFALGETEWLIEPQVEPPPAETGGVRISVDFVMRPATARSERRLAIFLDGWEFHQGRVGLDLRQRMALLASGAWDVFSFTWSDLERKPGRTAPVAPALELAVPDPSRFKGLLRQSNLQSAAPLADMSTFQWFERELLEPAGLPWAAIGKAALAARMGQASALDGRRWCEFVERSAPAAVRRRLLALRPLLISADSAEASPGVEWMAVHDGEAPALIAVLDDRPDQRASPAGKAAWQGFLRFFQLLRQVPDCWFMSLAELEQGGGDPAAYARLAELRAGEEKATGAPAAVYWAGEADIEPSYRELARRLAAAHLPEPVIGLEIPDSRGDTWLEAELVWPAAKLAICSREEANAARGAPHPDWNVLYCEELEADLSPIFNFLRRSP